MPFRIAVGTVRNLLREIAEDFILYNDQIYVSIEKKIEEIGDIPGLELLWYPPDWIIDELNQDIQTWQNNPDARTSQYIDDVKVCLERIGQNVYLEFIDEPGEDYFIVYARFKDGKSVHSSVSAFWLRVDAESPDWRPDEGLPEDYYAL